MENYFEEDFTENVNNKDNGFNSKKETFKKLLSGPGGKLIIIVLMCLAFLIPQNIIGNLVEERKNTEKNAGEEVFRKWGTDQEIRGIKVIMAYQDSTQKTHTENIFPEKVNISADVKTSQLKRGIYDYTVYETELKIEGEIKLPDNFTFNNDYVLDHNESGIRVCLKQTHGICDNITIDVDGIKIPMEYASGYETLVCKADLDKLLKGETVKFSLTLPFKASGSLYFKPLAKTTNINLSSNCATPSFNGDYLPNERNVNKKGFTATWNVFVPNLNNSNYNFGVELKVPVEQYLQTDRAIKYAFLIILLTFAAVFFVEMRKTKQIHPVQYLLVGIALTIFYLLLLSFSEHLSFMLSYIIASVMTIGLITVFMASVAKDRKTALGVGALLTTIYFFIYILLQLETFALLAGSIGIFIVLAIAMYATQKIEWYKNEK